MNKLNPDHDDPRYAAAPTGMYSPHCGLDRVLLNFSGAEYLTLLLQGQVRFVVFNTGVGGGGGNVVGDERTACVLCCFTCHLISHATQRHCLPAEALALVRYVDLDLWHSQASEQAKQGRAGQG